MQSKLQEISGRLFSLDTDQRRVAIERLKSKGIDVANLPIPLSGERPKKASYAQERLWFLWRMDPSNSAYNIANSVRFRGRLDLAALESAFETVCARHEILRTTFFENEDGTCLQQVASATAVPIEMMGSTGADGSAKPLFETLAREPFDLVDGPLWRLHLFRNDADDHVLLITMHHIVCDAWSMQILVGELANAYTAAALAAPATLQTLPIQYGDFAQWQRAWLETGEGDRQLRFWTERLGDDCPELIFGRTPRRPSSHAANGNAQRVVLAPKLTAELRALAARHAATLFAILLASFETLLHRYTGQADLRIGIPTSNRSKPELEPLIGLFVNTQVIRVLIAPDMTFATLLRCVQAELKAAQGNRDLPFEQIVDELNPTRRWDTNPLFQAMHSHQRLADLQRICRLGELDVALEHVSNGTAKFALSLETIERTDDIVCVLDSASIQLDPPFVARMATHFVSLLEAIVAAPDHCVLDYDFLSCGERADLGAWAQGDARPHRGGDVVSAIETRVKESPDAVALVHGDDLLTYGALNARANRLARRLRAFGIGPDDLVGLSLERSPAMVVALLAIMKAGGAYVPLDPSHPAGRLEHVIVDAGVRMIITEAGVKDRLWADRAPPSPLWLIDERPGSEDLSSEDLEANFVPRNLAYCIYTSGSTGRPKGVEVTHESLFNILSSLGARLGLSREDRFLAVTTMAFDIAGLELLMPLMRGASVIVGSRGVVEEPSQLARLLPRVSMMQATPTLWKALLEASGGQHLAGVRCLVGGEPLEAGAARLLRASCAQVVNLYGPTETTIWSASMVVDDDEEVSTIPIGRPIWNTGLHVLDGGLRPAPPGVAGELFIGGVGLARCYHRQPALTAERFIPNPFSDRPGERLYRTGDRAAWRRDGVLEFLGRVDHQVKIRGFRIELGEVEACLLEHASIRAAVAVVHESPVGKQLAAYVVLAKGKDFGAGGQDFVDTLKPFLQTMLPDYMVPSQIMVIDALPMTPNGKLDRRQLPEPTYGSQAPLSPSNARERTLVAVWRETLKLEKVGITDNFFALGGDSILSLQVVARARRAGLAFTPRLLFEHQTIQLLAPFVEEVDAGLAEPAALPDVGDRTVLVPSDVALSGLSQAQIDALPFAGGEIEDVYGLSPMQHGMLFHALHAPEAGHYVNQLSVTARGLDVARFEASWRAVVARHAVLRTSFVWGADVPAPLQIVHKSVPAAFAVVDRRDGEAADLAALARDERRRGFDLGRAPLQRMTVVLLPGGRACLIWTHHHLLTDGWSTARQIEEAFAHYLGEPLAPVRGRYRDYIAWLGRQDKAAGEAFWRAQLAGLETPSLLAEAFGGRVGTDAPTGDAADGHVRLVHRVDAAGRARLQRFAQAERITLNTLVQGAWTLLLQRLCGQASVVFGSTVAGRPAELAGSQEMLGLFINTLPVIQAPRAEQSVGAFLRALQEAAIAAREYEHVPLYDIQRWSGRPGQPLFDTVLVFENYPVDAALRQRSDQTLRFEDVRPVNPNSLGLTLNVDVSDGLVCTLIFAEARFGEPARRTILQGWSHLLEQLVADAARPLGTLSLLPEAARRRREGACRGEVLAAPAATVPALFASRVARCPDAPAVVCGGVSLSYGALAARARRLAGRLRRHGVGPERLVGLLAERSLEMVVGVLAILEAGGAYVPLDPAHPPRRLAQLLAEAAIDLVVGTRAATAPLAGHATPIVLDDDSDDGLDDDLDDDWAAAAARAAAPSEPGAAATAQNLAYVIFTSGSTGRPKGVAVTHGALVDYVRGIEARLGLGAARGMALVSTPAADLGHTVLYGALCSGGALHVVDADTAADAARFAAYLRAHRIDVLKIAASHLVGLGSAAGGFEDVLPRRALIVGGEALDATQASRLLRVAGGCRLYNHYGPTEATVGVTTFAVPPDWAGDALPLGAALPNVEAHILSAELDPVPAAVTGELYLGGPGLARGYHRRPGLTAERFVPNPFSAEPGARLYRTGDLARQRADGTIAYAGRADRQIKLRGYRVELGEIEARLLAHAAVREAVVVARPARSDKQLVGYVVTRTAPGAQAGDVAEDVVETLRAHLAAGLPDHMVPTHLVVLDRLPLTANGKLDRAALPEPDIIASEHVAPQTDIEKTLAAIWRDVLALETIGVTDNFFELGGDSILSLQIVAKAQRAGIEITSRQIFAHQTITSLALDAVAKSPATRSDDLIVSGALCLSPIQRWFFEQPIAQKHHWNQSVLLVARQALDLDALEAALHAVVAHHDALRLRFHQMEDGTWEAAHAGSAYDSFSLTVFNSRTPKESADYYEEIQGGLSLDRGPLLRAAYIRQADDSARLLLVVHHLVVDGVSWRILLEDLQDAYSQLVGGRSVALPAKTTSFRTWSERLRAFAESQALSSERAYWEDVLDARANVATLPRDYDVDQLSNGDFASAEVRLDRATTTQLLKEASEAYRTHVNDILLTALARVLCRWTASSSVLVDLEGHGREDVLDDIDVSRTVGWFTSLFPVRLAPGLASARDGRGDAGLRVSIRSIKEQLRAVPNGGIGYGVGRYLTTGRQVEGEARARVRFNYLGQFDQIFHGESLFAPSFESSGRQRHPNAPMTNWLIVTGQVVNGCLTMSFGYGKSMFRAATIETLAGDFRSELEALIAHCLEGSEGSLTPSDVALSGLSQAQIDALPFSGGEIEDVYGLSPMQHGMLFHALHAPEAGHYVNQLSVTARGLDVARFEASWRSVVARHAVLRTSFVWGADVPAPLQIVHKSVPAAFAVVDRRDDEAADLAALARDERRRGFDLGRAPLQRMMVVLLPGGRACLIWTHHHLLTDGWSTARQIEEAFAHYLGEPLAPVRGRYRDYIAWLGRQDKAAGETFWRAQLAGLETPSLLAEAFGGYAGADAPTGDAADGHVRLVHRVDAAGRARLQRFAQAERITLNTLVQGAWTLLLQRLCGQASVVFGSTVAGRPAELAGSQEMLGLFINTLPVIQAPRAEQSVGAFLRALQEAAIAAREYEHVPLYDIQRWSGRPGQPLFDTVLVFENYPIDAALRQRSDQTLRFEDAATQQPTNYPMTVLVNGLEEISFFFHGNRFSRPQVDELKTLFVNLLVTLSSPETQLIGDISIVGDAALQSILRWGRGATRPIPAACVHAFVEARARELPDACAVVLGHRSLTYAALNARANKLARSLRMRGVACGDLVGLLAERSLEMVVGILAILKAGAAYVPLDPDYPAQRLDFMISDSAVRLVLTQQSLLENAKARMACEGSVEFIDLDDRAAHEFSDGNLPPSTAPESLAYCIYTSGSTGVPKAAGNTHRSLVNRLLWMQHLLTLDEGEGVLQKTPISFDVSVWELLWPLMFGARVVLAPPGAHRQPEALIQVMREARVSVVHFVPSMLDALLEVQDRPLPANVRAIVCSGEALSPNLLSRAKARCDAALYNLYGPTEAAIDVTAWECDAADAVVPIGRPIWNTQLLILDSALQSVRPETVGELFIGGVALAMGYHRRRQLTAERFVPNPYASTPGERLYRTGDLARWRADGTIEYVGRSDHQVKVRGFRIELGEAETLLRSHAAVRQAIAVAQQEPPVQVVAYLVLRDASRDDTESVVSSIRAHLQSSAPSHMVPSQFVVLDELPLAPNGKVDRRALPRPSAGAASYVAPRDEFERVAAGLWQEVLGRDRIGIEENFFELGGDSILAIQLVGRLRAAGFPLTTGSLLTCQTIARLSEVISGRETHYRGTVVLRSQGRRPPVFCMHPFQGKVESYVAVTHAVLGDHRVVGFEANWLSEPFRLETSIEDIAATYATEIASCFSPIDSCFLLGWSWGGILAYELGRQIGSRYTINFAGLVDVHDLSARVEAYLIEHGTIDVRRAEKEFLERMTASPYRSLWESLLVKLADDERAALWQYFAQTASTWNSNDIVDINESREYRTILLFNRIHITKKYQIRESELVIKPWLADRSLTSGIGEIDWSQFSTKTRPAVEIKGVGHSELIRSKPFFESLALEISASS